MQSMDAKHFVDSGSFGISLGSLDIRKPIWVLPTWAKGNKRHRGLTVWAQTAHLPSCHRVYLSVGTSSQMGYKIQEAQFLLELLPEQKSSADKFGWGNRRVWDAVAEYGSRAGKQGDVCRASTSHCSVFELHHYLTEDCKRLNSFITLQFLIALLSSVTVLHP